MSMKMDRKMRRLLYCLTGSIGVGSLALAGGVVALVPEKIMAEPKDTIQVESININKEIVSPGDVVTITVKANGNVSEIDKVLLNIPGVPGHLDLSVSPDENGIISKSVKIDNTFNNREYRVSVNRIKDKNGGILYEYNSDLTVIENSFTVSESPQANYVESKIKAVRLDKDSYVTGEKALVTVEMEEHANDIDHVRLTYGYISEYGARYGYWYEPLIRTTITPDDNGNLTGEFHAPDLLEYGYNYDGYYESEYRFTKECHLIEAVVVYKTNNVEYHPSIYLVSDLNSFYSFGDVLTVKCSGVRYIVGQLKKIKDNDVDTNYTGLDKYEEDGVWYYFNNGVYSPTYSGVAKSTNGKLYYVKKGKWDQTYTGLAKYSDGKWYYMKKGKHDPTYTGLSVSTNGKFYYVRKGVWNKSYTGFAKNTNGNWFFVRNGCYDGSYTGLAYNENNGGWFYAYKGRFNKKYTGIAKSTNGKLYYVKNGRWNKSYTGLAKSTNGKWYYVKNGSHTKYTGIAKSTNGKKYYVKNGVWDTTFTGKAKDTAGKTYNVKNGRVI